MTTNPTKLTLRPLGFEAAASAGRVPDLTDEEQQEAQRLFEIFREQGDRFANRC